MDWDEFEPNFAALLANQSVDIMDGMYIKVHTSKHLNVNCAVDAYFPFPNLPLKSCVSSDHYWNMSYTSQTVSSPL